MRPIRLLLALVALVATAHAFAAPVQDDKKDKVLSTKTVTGTVIGFEVGDYVHVVVKDAKGKEGSYYAGPFPTHYFLAAHVNKPLKLTVNKVSSFFEEAGERMEVERIDGASYGKLSVAAWWKAERKKASEKKLIDKYEKAIAKLNRAG
ncbi:MAG: hypothetical protein KIS66_07395 [Fimbriimonadaceae bacterium]|nr:hypothetical protein [Fimbriimonadaceae bacterium]